jgi:hypothetical protein
VGCYLDLDEMKISFTKNGVDLGLAFNINKSQEKNPFFPAIVLKVIRLPFKKWY